MKILIVSEMSLPYALGGGPHEKSCVSLSPEITGWLESS